MVYLDYNASTPVDQRVLSLVAEAHEAYGNPASSHHKLGHAAAELIEEARDRVACLFTRRSQDIIFTSGATEAAVLGLVGAMLGARGRPNAVVSTTEHKAILAAAELGARLTGGEIRKAKVGEDGIIDLAHLAELVDESVSLVAVMAANNETGVIAPVSDVVDIAHQSECLVFIDATQLVGKGSLHEAASAADLMICSSHKIYGPKGAGALVASRTTQKAIVPLMPGGGQERGIRGGTQNTPSIVGFGLAAELAMKEQAADEARIGQLAEELLAFLMSELSGVRLNSGKAKRLSNTLNVRFEGADAEAVMASMPDVLVSSGSACQSAVPSPSHVLLAMGRSRREASESLRISLGRPTTGEEIRQAGRSIVEAVSRVRQLTSD
ncbi:cysteine desulfurase [Mycolicibacterium agri]|uniref:Cysteine desulfurase n=1 Tax=Mycolicibacterium agri TaxID=36811 RepID=A0A2A7MRQ9_MYCAG|nr:cysteine desulfurase family protein [Mycolicibacterium agri]PEG34364.1 cysteine desulfurase [Mycolicibacterium agri]GFG52338.1 cysteine desulfurase [Mycolicibacterium agri]